jgi:hypothetical protein
LLRGGLLTDPRWRLVMPRMRPRMRSGGRRVNLLRALRNAFAGPHICADLEALIEATREHYGLPAYTPAQLEQLARDAARRSGCPLCQTGDEATPCP